MFVAIFLFHVWIPAQFCDAPRCEIIYVGVSERCPDETIDFFMYPGGLLRGVLQPIDDDDLPDYIQPGNTKEDPSLIRLELISRKETSAATLDDFLRKIRAASKNGYVRVYVAIKE